MADKFVVRQKKYDKKEDKNVVMSLRYALEHLEFIPGDESGE